MSSAQSHHPVQLSNLPACPANRDGSMLTCLFVNSILMDRCALKNTLEPIWDEDHHVLDHPDDPWCGEKVVSCYTTASVDFEIYDKDKTGTA